MKYFDRRVILKIYRGSGIPKAADEIVTTIDSAKGFRIVFDVEKHITSDPNIAKIQVFNLLPSKIEAISDNKIWVELYAGYRENVSLLYAGAIATVSVRKNGPDTVLFLVCRTDWKLETKMYGGYAAPGVDVKGMILHVLKTCDIPHSPEHILISGNAGDRGWTSADSVKKILDSLGRLYNFSWSIQDYGFLALDDNIVLDSQLRVTSPIIDAYTLPKEDERTSDGYDITCILNGAFQIGYNVVFNSKYKKEREFKIYSLGHSGDTHENTWFTNLRGYLRGSLTRKPPPPKYVQES
jgi:hypothetical protein